MATQLFASYQTTAADQAAVNVVEEGGRWVDAGKVSGTPAVGLLV